MFPLCLYPSIYFCFCLFAFSFCSDHEFVTSCYSRHHASCFYCPRFGLSLCYLPFCSWAHTLSRIALLVCFGFSYMPSPSYLIFKSHLPSSTLHLRLMYAHLLVFAFDTLSFFSKLQTAMSIIISPLSGFTSYNQGNHI
jgi:hypothetical protein